MMRRRSQVTGRGGPTSPKSVFWLKWIITSAAAVTIATAADYGFDCSFPIHHADVSQCVDSTTHTVLPLGAGKQELYERFLQGCRDYYGGRGDRCDDNENGRLSMNYLQPTSIVNYTATGYKKIKAPVELMELIWEHWNASRAAMYEEAWMSGNIYANHWESPSSMASFEDAVVEGGPQRIKNMIWDEAKTIIEAWTGMELQATSLYGIRVYTEGAILSPHVDRLPLISSAIINVDQDVDEPWVLEVYDRNNQAVNITMEPGDMVLYESASLVHGRPFPLKGRLYANVFIHFEPTGRPLGDKSLDFFDNLDTFYPPYILPDTEWAAQWAAQNPQGWKTSPSADIQQLNSPEGHHAAAIGDILVLHRLVEDNPRALVSRDANGWQPIHEAVRSGNREVVELLIQHGADKDVRTWPNNKGASPLKLALEHHEVNHPVVQYLLDIGAASIAEEDL